MNSNRPIVYYSDARHQFLTKSPSPFLRLLLYFQKNSKQDNKRQTFPQKMTVNVSIFFQTSGVIASIVYYSNTIHHLLEVSFTSFRYYVTFEKKFQTFHKVGRFFSKNATNEIVLIHQISTFNI